TRQSIRIWPSPDLPGLGISPSSLSLGSSARGATSAVGPGSVRVASPWWENLLRLATNWGQSRFPCEEANMAEREFIQQLADAEICALVEVMFLAAESDGEVTDDEILSLSQTTERVTNGQVAQQRAHELLQQAKRELAASDR